jgi:hypothetical protein
VGKAAKISAVSPVGTVTRAGGPLEPLRPPAARLDTLENKTIYLVDTGFGGSYRFMQELQRWFQNNMPSVTTLRKRKSGGVFTDDSAGLWEEIKARGQAVVIGVGG